MSCSRRSKGSRLVPTVTRAAASEDGAGIGPAGEVPRERLPLVVEVIGDAVQDAARERRRLDGAEGLDEDDGGAQELADDRHRYRGPGAGAEDDVGALAAED